MILFFLGARSLIINHSLDSGTILPYLKKAQERGFDIIVTNTNDNYRDGKRIEGSGNPEEHARNVWEKIIMESDPKSIAIVAHSYGGIVTSELARKFQKDFEKKVVAVAFTDSVHGSRGLSSHIVKNGINFVSSNDPLGHELRSHEDDIKRVSAGHPKHEYTSWACIEALFKFIDGKYHELEENGQTPVYKRTKTEEL